MQPYKFDFTIEAGSADEARQKMQALAIMAKKLKPKELIKFAQVVERDPITLALAKKYLKL
jgi:hypothetical protein